MPVVPYRPFGLYVRGRLIARASRASSRMANKPSSFPWPLKQLVRAWYCFPDRCTTGFLRAWCYERPYAHWQLVNVKRACRDWGWKRDGDTWIAPSSWRR
jgi:hypothetical protein